MKVRLPNEIAATRRPAKDHHARGVPVRLYILSITLAAILPLLALAGLFAARYVAAETERFERSVRDQTFAVALDIERELTASIAVLRALANSRALQLGNLEEFHAEARAVREVLGANVILRSTEGRQLVSTFFPWGATLPTTSSLLRWDPEALATGLPVVTGHYVGIVGGAHSYAIIVPVKRGGEIAWLLHATFDTRRLRDILAAARLTDGSRAGITDRDRIVLASRDRHEQSVGTPATNSSMPPTSEEQIQHLTSRGGDEVVLARRRLPSSGWHVGVAVPVETVLSPLRRTLWAAAAAALALLALALAGAFFFGHRLSGAIAGLAAYGEALEGGQPATPPAGPVREVNEVGAALAAAASRHRLMLHELNHRVRNTLAMMDALVRLSARHATGVADYEARLSKRIRALAQTHVLLGAAQGGGASLAELLRSELAAHEAEGARRLRLHGPPLTLGARQAASVGMLLHELATNAAKYGALSRGEGRITVSWRIQPPAPPETASRLVLHWVESGGPPVTPPTRKGFGTTLIERALARDLAATITAEYPPEGFRFRLTMPLPTAAELVPPAPLASAAAAPPAPEVGSPAAP